MLAIEVTITTGGEAGRPWLLRCPTGALRKTTKNSNRVTEPGPGTELQTESGVGGESDEV